MKLRTFILGLFFVPCVLSAATILSDNFDDNSLDSSLWGTILPIYSDSSVTEANGALTSTARGILYTQSSITGAYSITGDVTLLNVGEIFTVALHSNTDSFGSYYERQGLLVHFCGTDVGTVLQIEAYDGAYGTTILSSVSYTFTANTEYSFNIVDTGSSLSVYVEDLLVTSISYTYTYGGSQVAFYSREVNTACSSTIDNIVISSVPEPATCAAALGFGALGLAFLRRRRNA